MRDYGDYTDPLFITFFLNLEYILTKEIHNDKCLFRDLLILKSSTF